MAKDILKIALGIVFAVILLIILMPILGLIGNLLLLGFLKLGSMLQH